MSSYQFSDKSIRSHSIHVAIARDYQRIQMTKKQDLKLAKEFLNLERKLNSHAKWNERADHRNARHNSTANLNHPQDQPPITLKEYLAREKIKQENISNAKKIANGNIRRHTKALLFRLITSPDNQSKIICLECALFISSIRSNRLSIANCRSVNCV